jgi:hypothetical protein
MAKARTLNQKIRFRCACGVPLRAEPSAAGRVGTCKKCGNKIVVPTVADKEIDGNSKAHWSPSISSKKATLPADDGRDSFVAEPQIRNKGEPRHSTLASQTNETIGDRSLAERATSPEPVKEVAKILLCNICQTQIQAGEPCTTCSECHLPFHAECWEENLGCSAYGCPNVNAMKSGPDIRITNPPPLPPQSHFSNNNLPADDGEIPWEYLLLAASALAAVLSSMCYGIFSLVIGVVVFLYFVASGKDKPSFALVMCIGISLIGLIAGMTASIYFWW